MRDQLTRSQGLVEHRQAALHGADDFLDFFQRQGARTQKLSFAARQV